MDGIGIAKYCSESFVFADMKMKVPFVSRTVGMIHFVSSLKHWFCELHTIFNIVHVLLLIGYLLGCVQIFMFVLCD